MICEEVNKNRPHLAAGRCASSHQCVNIKQHEAGNQHPHPLIISLKTSIETYRCIRSKYYLNELKQSIYFSKYANSLYFRLRIFLNLSLAAFLCFRLFSHTLSVVPITVKCPNHFKSLSWWDSIKTMPVSTLDTQKCTPRLTKQNQHCAFLLCFWRLALWKDILLSFSAFGPLLLRLIFTLSLNCCVFVVASVCQSVCNGEIGAWEPTFNAPKKWLIIAFLCLYQGFSPPLVLVPVNTFMSESSLYEGRTFF